MSSWLIVLIYIVPILGTIAQICRRVEQIWNIGKSIRSFLPDDRVFRKLKEWEKRFLSWKFEHPLSQYTNLLTINLWAGKIEYAIGHLRDYTIGLWMMGAFVYDLTVMVLGDPSIRTGRFPTLFYHGFFALLTLWTYRRHVGIGLKVSEFLRVNPQVHPQELFDHYYRRLGPLAVPIPSQATRTVQPTHVSYRTGKKPQKRLWPILHGAYDTAIFARSVYRALETLGPHYGREIFDVMASFWGSRVLQLFQCELHVEGAERFHSLDGKIILIFNHKSLLDFVFNFFALSNTHLAKGRPLRPRFLAAKDHFIDNKLIHSGLGVGRTIQEVGMVFVDRKGQGRNAIDEAVNTLLKNEIDLAMYPQGTRALANSGPKGERLDAGYYTTGTANSLKRELGHLKKGCAYLALDSAIALSKREPEAIQPIHLVFIAIDGVATVFPKGTLQIQTGERISYRVGDIFTLDPLEVKEMKKPTTKEPLDESENRYERKIDEIQEAIDRSLTKALRLHENLLKRFQEEMRRSDFVPKFNQFKLTHQLSSNLKNGERLPFVILDRILALPPDKQQDFLKRFSEGVLSGGDLRPLRDEITDLLFRHRGKELKTIVQQEQAKKIA
ncbi:MAG: 1-acyl-sn-glycerol-3-phosphate acyltransferase [Deltaproteobacteria bacterium]|nr:1-acyl-sn-glycerol-3-phosphate acyltransferase [Deltaproteobacteria bacterium]